MDGWKTSFLSGWPIFRGYVSFKECNSDHQDQSIFLLDACPTALFNYCSGIRFVIFRMVGVVLRQCKRNRSGQKKMRSMAAGLPRLLGWL